MLGTHLGGNPLTSVGAQALAAALNDALPRAASNRATRLEALALEDCQVGAEGAKRLAEQLATSALMALSLARNGLVDDDATQLLLALPKALAFLDLSGNQLSDLTASNRGRTALQAPRLVHQPGGELLEPHDQDALGRGPRCELGS